MNRVSCIAMHTNHLVKFKLALRAVLLRLCPFNLLTASVKETKAVKLPYAVITHAYHMTCY